MPDNSVADVLDRFNRPEASETAPADDVVARFEMQATGRSPEEFAAFFVNQDDIEGESGSASTRAFINLFGDTPEEQDAAFVSLHPEGEIVRPPATDIVLFRKNKDEKFRKLDPGFFEAMGLDLKGFVKETGADIADIAGAAPEMAGEALSMFASRGRAKGGGKLVGDLARLATGGMLGETGQQALQNLQETQRQSLEDQARLVGGAGVESVVGGTLGAGFGSILNLSRGRSIASAQPEALEVVDAAKRLGTKPPLPSQVSDIPFLQLLGRQSQAVVPRIKRYLVEQERRTADAVKALLRPKDQASFIQKTATAFDDATNSIVNGLTTVAGKGRSLRKGGRAIQQGIREWWDVSGKDVDNLYSVARSIEEPRFSLDNLLETAQSIKEGTPAVFQAGKVRNVSETSPELIKVIDDLQSLDPNLPPVTRSDGTVVSAVDTLRELRKRVDDLTLAGPEGPRQAQANAKKLKAAIVDTLKNPTNGNVDFVNAWKVADQVANKRFAARERIAVVEAANTETPSRLASSLASPGQLDNLVVLRKIMPPKRFGQLQESFKGQLLRDPMKMKARLDEFDAETLNVLMSKSEQGIFKQAATRLDKLNSAGVQEALAKQTEVSAFFDKTFLEPGQTVRATVLKDFVQEAGGADSPMGKSVRAALVDSIWRRSKIVERGVEKVDFNRLQGVMKEAEDAGLLGFLTKKDISTLNDAKIVQDFSRFGSDAGTSLQAASAVATMRGGGLEGFTTLVENMTVGRLIVSPLVVRALTGAIGKQSLDTRFVKLLGALAANISVDAEQQRDLGEDVGRLIELSNRDQER